ncbi:hypothetical protein GCM10023155_20910 [Bremerella cremea]
MRAANRTGVGFDLTIDHLAPLVHEKQFFVIVGVCLRLRQVGDHIDHALFAKFVREHRLKADAVLHWAKQRITLHAVGEHVLAKVLHVTGAVHVNQGAEEEQTWQYKLGNALSGRFRHGTFLFCRSVPRFETTEVGWGGSPFRVNRAAQRKCRSVWTILGETA